MLEWGTPRERGPTPAAPRRFRSAGIFLAPRGRNEEVVTNQLRPEDTRTWLEMLFRPGDLFEVRVKDNEQHGTQQHWLPYSKIDSFVSAHIPIHTDHGRHVWVGIAPRPKVGDASPTLHRALWVDFDATVTSIDRAKDAITEAELPPPTMLVWSGNGVHGYWALSRDYAPTDVRPRAKGLHACLPADTTHDSSRIMRVPGTLNLKDPANPTPCYIAEHHPERVYELEVFPKLAVRESVVAEPGAVPKAMRPLSDEDRALFVSRWTDGDKHHLVLGVAGYLRKNLNYDEASALAEIQKIHRLAGYEPTDGLERDVRDTYAQLWAKVAGLSKLQEMGVVPAQKGGMTIRFAKPKKRRIEVIDFNQEQQEQEFWVDGLVGPGLLTLWAAEPKTGKSFAAMQIGYALASGTPLWDFQTTEQKLRVLYFQGELSKGMVYARAKAMFGVPAVKNPRRYAMTAKPDEPIDLVASPEVLTDLAEDYDVVIVDPISVFTTNDESRSHTVNEVVGLFDPLRAQGKAVMLVHHLRKLDQNRDGTPVVPGFNDIRGSSAWFATADAIALHYRLGEDANTRVKFMFRAAPERDELNLFRLPHGGFTHDKHAYLAHQPKLRVSAAAELN